MDPEIVANPGDTLRADQMHMIPEGGVVVTHHPEEGSKAMHKDFGKTPAYLNKYKKEAEVKAEEKAAARAKAKIPAGMR